MRSTHPDGSPSTPAAQDLRRIEQGGQADLDGTGIVVHRTLEDEDGPYAVLTVRAAGATGSSSPTVHPGQRLEMPGAGSVLVVAVRPSTLERPGAVYLVGR